MAHKEYKISGVSVYFPCKPYPSQFSMMDKIIKGIDRRQHCLLESPTGSGKSLALLCSSLGWQAKERAKKEQEEAEAAEKATCLCQCHCGPEDNAVTRQDAGERDARAAARVAPGTFVTSATAGGASATFVNATTDIGALATPAWTPSKERDAEVKGFGGNSLTSAINLDDDDDFRLDTPIFENGVKKKDARKHIKVGYEEEAQAPNCQADCKTQCQTDCAGDNITKGPELTCGLCPCGKGEITKIKVPKIYFGTRTHKQVAQIVRELRKTQYQDTKMTILGSREHTCIHPRVSKSKNKNEGCKELLTDRGCRFKDATQRMSSQRIIKDQGLASAWDLEDLVKMCKVKKACPYFLSRALREEADLVICPYNYLVDPIIRESMMINLKGNVVILDEAHNIEDAAREAASQSIGQDTIEKAVRDIDALIEQNISLADYSRLRGMVNSLNGFIEENRFNLDKKDFDKSYKIWTGFYIVAQMENMGLGPKHFPDLKAALANVKIEAEEKKEQATAQGLRADSVILNPASQSVLDQMFQVMDYLYRADMKYVDDYRAALVQSSGYVNSHGEQQEGGWLNSKKSRGLTKVDIFTLNFWCLNPGVAFSDFALTRSVILTSGTLSPMASFQSELGLEFKIQLEASHVIKDNQVWVGALGHGPGGNSLQAVYRNLETYTFQDELGALVLRVCQTVPHGVLCFLPSYKVMEKLGLRWESTGLLNKMNQIKLVITEPRGSNKENFEEEMKSFYDTVSGDRVDDDAPSTRTGAIFFAVCRGKVSEGLDFADNFARAVITVGIPYPNFKDVQVELKREYNDKHRASRGLLSGADWYEIQAFRALNQALGRCIRHKNDWGALIIVDERFVKNKVKYCKGLSKWVRSKVQTFPDFRCAQDSLNDFTIRSTETMSTLPNMEASFPDNKACSEAKPKIKAVPSFSIFSPLKPLDSPKSSAMTIKIMGHSTPKSYAAKFQRTIIVPNNKINYYDSPATPSNPKTQQTPSASSNNNNALTPFLLVPNSNNKVERRLSDPSSTDSNLKISPPNTIKISNINTTGTDEPVQLKIVTEVANPGQRFKVFEIPSHLQKVFGGNLNLPVSTKERLVYVIDPPSLAGGNPTAKLVKMSEEEKEAILTNQKGLQKMEKPAVLSTSIAKQSLPTAKVRPITSTDQNVNKVLPNSSSVSETHPREDLLVDDIRTKSNKPVVPPVSSHSKLAQFTFHRKTEKNPDSVETVLQSIKPKSEVMPVLLNSNIQNNVQCPLPLQQKQTPVHAIPHLNSPRPLFRKTKPLVSQVDEVSSSTTLTPGASSALSSSKANIDTITPSKNVRLAAARSVESPASDSDDVIPISSDGDEFVPNQIKRKVKSKKRKSMSLGNRASAKKVKETKTPKQVVNDCSFSCIVCLHSLIPHATSADFKEQRTTPGFLREKENEAQGNQASMFFSGITKMSWLQPLRGSLGLNTKFVEQEEICVQFLYCGACLKANPVATPTASGAQVQLAAGSGARFSKGQMWLFADRVKISKD